MSSIGTGIMWRIKLDAAECDGVGLLRPSTSRDLGDRKNHYVKFCVKGPNIDVSSCV